MKFRFLFLISVMIFVAGFYLLLRTLGDPIVSESVAGYMFYGGAVIGLLTIVPAVGECFK